MAKYFLVKRIGLVGLTFRVAGDQKRFQYLWPLVMKADSWKDAGRNAHRMVRVYVPFRLPCPELGIADRSEIELHGAASIRPGGVAQKQDAQHPHGAGNHHWDRRGH